MPEGREDHEAGDSPFEAILAITDSALADLSVEELLRQLVRRVAALLGSDTAVILLLDSSGQQLNARAAFGIEEEVRQGVRVSVGAGFAGRIAATRSPLALDQIDPTTVVNPLLWERGLHSMLGVPLVNGTDVVGVLHVGSISSRVFSEDDVKLLELVAERLVSAIEHRELAVRRMSGEVLQRNLLPSALPRCPGIEFATRFVPAEEGDVGGDWYDAFRLPTGELWIMAGDVGGHGLGPALVMGRLRSSLRSYALLGLRPSEVLAASDRKLQLFEPDQFATALCARALPPYDTFEIASAGHLPPVLALVGESARFVEIPLAPPLGTVDEIAPRSTTVDLPPGAAFVAYTDGLVERRHESLELGLERLRAAVRAEAPDLVCQEVMEALVGRDVPRDDIAVLALRRSTTAHRT